MSAEGVLCWGLVLGNPPRPDKLNLGAVLVPLRVVYGSQNFIGY